MTAVDAAQLAELRQLLAEATEGPWFVASREGDDEAWWIWADRDEPFTVAQASYGGPDNRTDGEAEEADAALIVAAVNALPALLAAAEERDRLRAAIEMLRRPGIPSGLLDASEDL